MTTIIVCPKCGVESLRSSRVRIICRHAYHDAKDCGVCIWCREGLPWPPKDDEPRENVDA